MEEVTVPLQQLQDIGERYSPQVLRSFFLARPVIGQQISSFPEVFDLPSSNRIRNLLVWSQVVYLVSLFAGVLLYPHIAGVSMLITGSSISILSEMISIYHLRKWSWIAIIWTISGILNRLCQIFHFLSFISIASSVWQLALIGLAPFSACALWILLQIRTVVSLFRSNDYFRITNWTKVSASEPWSLAARSEADMVPDAVLRASSCPPNHEEITKLAHAAIVFEFNGLYLTILKHFSPISIQTDLVLISSAKALGLMLGFQLLTVPVQVFYVYDVDQTDSVVLASMVLSIAAAMLSCILNVIPTHRRDISDYV